MHPKATLFLLFLLISGQLFAQQTGNIDWVFPSSDPLLNGDSIRIQYYVPADYDGTTPFKLLVGVHGLGDPQTPEEIRTYLSATGDSIDAIVMCPAPYLGDQPESEAVLNIALDSTFARFNLDPDESYIAGYSAGSDVAAQYVFQNPVHPMKGLIWYAPGFFANPNMANALTFPPVCLCWGDQDLVSIFQASTLNNLFSGSQVPYFYNEIPGVGHTMNFPGITDEVLECIQFIDGTTMTSRLVDASSTHQVNVYPNPANDQLTFSLASPPIHPISISIQDLTGREAEQFTVVPDQPTAHFTLDTRHFPEGFWLATIRQGARQSVVKFLIRR